VDLVILFGVLIVVLNVLDSVSTRLCFSLPEGLKGRESNPIMASLMEGDYLIAELVKHFGLLLMVTYWVYRQDVEVLLAVTSVFGLVVLNNSFIYATRRIVKKKISTPFGIFSKVCKICRMPNWVEYIVVIAVIFGVARWVSSMILGVS